MNLAINKDIKSKRKLCNNHFHNILRLLVFYQILLSQQVRQCRIITYKDCIYELPYELLNYVNVRT